MNKIKYLLLLILVSCIGGLQGFGQSTSQNDEDMSHYIDKIKQYPGRTKNLEKLKQTYDDANKTDKENIKALLETGQPDIWFDIYQAYMKLDKRQRMVMTLPATTLQQLSLEITDYKLALSESKFKAQAYLFARGEKLLQSEKPEDARLAYTDFMKLAGLNPSYPDLDKMIRKSILKGATNMEFEMANRTRKVVSSSMIDQLTIIIWEFKKARYGQVKPAQVDNSFAFILRVILDDMQIGSDQVKDLEYQEERDILEGDKVVDTISCLVQESRQFKKAQLVGSLEYVDKQTGQVVNHIGIKVESVFSNAYATLQGNPDAAGDDTRALLKSKKAAYPSNEQMILDATEEFAKKAKEIILSE